MNEPNKTTDLNEALVRRILAEHTSTALTPAELASVREILEADRRWKWFASGLKTWALWIAALIGAASLSVEALKSSLRLLLGK